MTHKAMLVAAALCWSTHAVAADTRVRTVSYDPEAIVRIVGHAHIQSTVQFGADERIENVAVGDSSAWQITPNRRGSVLFIKPVAPVSRTNLTVVTDKRTYMFDLVTASKRASAPLYVLKFSYKGEAPVTSPLEQQPVVLAAASVAKASPGPDRLSFDWKAKGFGKLRPERMFDDGTSLYLSWDKAVSLPAILAQSADGRESPLNYRMAGEYIVLTPVPQRVVLRYGKKAATIRTSRRPDVPQQRPTAAFPAGPKQAPKAFENGEDVAKAVTPLPAAPKQAPAASQNSRLQRTEVRVANLSSLYSDNVTDGAHDR